MNTDVYTQFKLAFLDQVALKGYDANFIEGFFKRAEDEYANWDRLVAATYKGDRSLCKQAYIEAAFALDNRTVEKRAENGLGLDILGLLDQLGGNIGQAFGQQAGAGLGGAVAGGGGGMLLGLLLSQLFDIPLPVAMLLGALGGSALGYGAAGTQKGQERVFGVKPPGAPEQPSELNDLAGAGGPKEAPATASNAAVPQTQPQADPAPVAAKGVAQGQAVANAAAAGAPPPVATPQAAAAPAPQPKPPVPSPQTTPTPGAGLQPPAPLTQPSPVAPPAGGMPTIKPPEPRK